MGKVGVEPAAGCFSDTGDQSSRRARNAGPVYVNRCQNLLHKRNSDTISTLPYPLWFGDILFSHSHYFVMSLGNFQI